MKSASSKEKLAKFFSNIDDEEFAYALLNELVHSFLAAEQSSIQVNILVAFLEIFARIRIKNFQNKYFPYIQNFNFKKYNYYRIIN